MRFHGFGQATSHSSLDRMNVDAQRHSFRRRMFARVEEKRLGEV
jgi:hypothetical protein